MRLGRSTRVAVLLSLLIHAALFTTFHFIQYPSPTSAPHQNTYLLLELSFREPTRTHEELPRRRGVWPPTSERHPAKQDKRKLPFVQPTLKPELKTLTIEPGDTIISRRKSLRRISDLTFTELDSLGRSYPEIKEALVKAWIMEAGVEQDSTVFAQKQRFAAMLTYTNNPLAWTAQARNRHPLYGTPYDPMRAHYSQNQINLLGVLKFLQDLLK